jgi:hypothetical protein
MKKLIFIAALVSGIGATTSIANAQQDSLKGKSGAKGKSINYGKTISIIGSGDEGIYTSKHRDSLNKVNQHKARFVGGITFTRFDLGFSKLIDNGSFSLSPSNQFLDYQFGKTSHVSFDVLQLGYRFNSHFKIYLAGGFDWTLIRLKRDITMQKNAANLSYTNESIHFDKNRLSSSYLHIPLNFELRSKQNDKYFYFVFGPEISFLLNGKVKQISGERGKEKFKDDYNFAPFRYGANLRFGYDNLGVFVKYYANDMFDSVPQKGLKNMAFGLTLGLN